MDFVGVLTDVIEMVSQFRLIFLTIIQVVQLLCDIYII